MTSSMEDKRLRARVAIWRDRLWALGDEGDPFAMVLRGGLDDPYRHYEEVRARGKLYLSTTGTWVTADYELANQVLRDKRFGVLKANGEKTQEFLPFDNSLLGKDPPVHTRMRKATIPALNPRRIDEEWRTRAEQICHRLVDEMLASGSTFEFMTSFARKLPIEIISDLVGIPESHRGRFARISRAMTPIIEGVLTVEGSHAVTKAIAELTAMITELIELRQVEPRDDVMSNLLPAVEAGQMTKDEAVTLCMFLPLAGSETTVNLVANGIMQLLRHPEQWRALCEDPGLAAGAVVETLRFDSPVQQYRRIAHQDVEIEGHVVREGYELAILAAGANRDPVAFPNGHVFDITRKPGPATLSFSAGIHFCMGAALARLEAEVAFQVLAARLPRLRQAGPIRRTSSFIIRGLSEFPLTVT